MAHDPAPTPASAPAGSTLDSLAIDRMRRRVRALRALRGAVEYAVWGLALATFALLGARLGVVPASRAKGGLALAAALPFVGAAIASARAVPALLAAQLLDRRFGLHDRLSSALQFRALPDAERTPWMRAAIDDAADVAGARPLEPAQALGWRWPAEARVALGLAATLALVGAAEFRVARVVREARPASAGARDPLVIQDDDLQAFRELSREMQRNAATPGARETLREFDRFLDDVARQRLDRQEAFRRLAAVQQTLDANQREDREGLRQTLQDVGQRMGDRNDMTREVSQALQQGDLQRAQESMTRLAERLRQERQLSEQQRQDLARALQHAAEPQDHADLQRRVEQARREVEQMLQRQREHQLSQSDEDLLHRRQHQSESLQREQERNAAQRREVEHLQRELSQAAQDLLRDQGAAAQDLDQGAQELSRMQDEQRSQQSLEELRRQLEELREQMRQQNGQNGQRQRTRLAQFSRAAGARPGQGQQGQQGNGQQGNGQQGQGPGRGNGQQGQAGGGTQGAEMQPGDNGQPGGRGLVMERGAGGMPMQGPQALGPQRGPPQPDDHDALRGAGFGHDENMRGAAVDTAHATQTVQVHGQQTGNGPSRSQVIRTAASDGFASAPYRQVYAPYWEHAREVLHQGEVPPGYRSYVRRYFQLIRPRGE